MDSGVLRRISPPSYELDISHRPHFSSIFSIKDLIPHHLPSIELLFRSVIIHRYSSTTLFHSFTNLCGTMELPTENYPTSCISLSAISSLSNKLSSVVHLRIYIRRPLPLTHKVAVAISSFPPPSYELRRAERRKEKGH